MPFSSFVFYHIPKCGGTSFRNYINQCALNSDIVADEIYIPGCNGLSNDKNLNQLTKEELEELRSRRLKVVGVHMKCGDIKKYDLNIIEPFRYTILRNPVERFMSHYNFFNYKLGNQDCKGVGLNELDEKKFDEILSLLSNVQINFLIDVKHPRLLSDLNRLKIACYNLQHEFHGFSLFFGSAELPMLNVGKNESNVNETRLGLIGDSHRLDMKLFSFAQRISK